MRITIKNLHNFRKRVRIYINIFVRKINRNALKISKIKTALKMIGIERQRIEVGLCRFGIDLKNRGFLRLGSSAEGYQKILQEPTNIDLCL